MATTGTVGSFRSGKGGRITVVDENGTAKMKMAVYTVKETGNKLDTTNFECFTDEFGSTGSGDGRSFSQGLVGVETADCTVTGLWEFSQNPFDDPPGIFVRDDGPLQQMFLSRNDAQFYKFFETLITTCTVKVSVKGDVSFDYGFENQGPYIGPTGSAI